MSTTKLAHAARRLHSRLTGNRRIRDRLDRFTQPPQHPAPRWQNVQRGAHRALEECEG